jgi:poly-gamma-glutamate synthesis protein (capsule biosynthesis protein)
VAIVTLMLCGDVMTGRGIDQVLPHPSEPTIYEAGATSALDYVDLAEAANGPIGRALPYGYVWGEALAELAELQPDLRIINLETAVTRSPRPAAKGINYRMHPGNAPVLTAAGVDCCVIANNHVMDWGREGLIETVDTLRAAGIRTAGAGLDLAEAQAPAELPVAGKGRVLVYAFGCASAGVPRDWAAASDRPGVSFLDQSHPAAIQALADRIRRDRRPDDVVVCALHWGPNWGYDVDDADRAFAHGLIDAAGVDIVYGHSSHHPKAIELHHGRPILYGCGDFLNDYEGIAGYEAYRDDLALMYLVAVDTGSGRLAGLTMSPFRIRNFRLGHADRSEIEWLQAIMDRECRRFGGTVRVVAGGRLALTVA